MDENLFQGLVGAGFVWTNRNLADASRSLSELQFHVRQQQIAAQELQRVKNIVFKMREYLEGLRLQMTRSAAMVYIEAVQIRDLFEIHGITVDVFDTFQDKEYFSATTRLLSEVIEGAVSALPDSAREDIHRYFWYKRLLPDLSRVSILSGIMDRISQAGWMWRLVPDPSYYTIAIVYGLGGAGGAACLGLMIASSDSEFPGGLALSGILFIACLAVAIAAGAIKIQMGLTIDEIASSTRTANVPPRRREAVFSKPQGVESRNRKS